MDKATKKDLFEVLDAAHAANPGIIPAVLGRVNAGDIEGRWYTSRQGDGVYEKNGETVYWSPRFDWQAISKDALAFTFDKDCGCLKGIIAIESGCDIGDQDVLDCLDDMGIEADASLPIEEFVYGIHYGDTPETSELSRELRDAIIEYMNQNRSEKGESNNG